MKELLRTTNAYSILSADRASGQLPHAVLVVFPDGDLLRALLTECAKAIFGAEDGSREEKLIGEEHFADCIFLPEAGGKLTADLCARIIDESILRPVEGKKKLFVLDAFHTAAPLVQNKLLKVLEEPPEGVYFLLGATAEHSVLPTVLSRVKKIAAEPFREEDVERALVRGGAKREEAREAAAACGGIYSVAKSLLAGGGEQFRLAEEFLLTDEPEKFCRSLGDKQDKRAFFAALSQVLRDGMMCAAGQSGYAAGKRAGTEIAKRYPLGAIVRAAELVRRAETEIEFNANFGQCALALATEIGRERARCKQLS